MSTSVYEGTSVVRANQVVCRYDIDKPNSVLRAEMEQDLAPECAEWLLQEMQENRKKGIRKTKQYCQKQLAQAITSGDAKRELQRHWGSHPMLETLIDNPAVLDAVARSMRTNGAMATPVATAGS